MPVMTAPEKTSRYEANVLSQPRLLRELLSAPAPAWMKPPRGRRALLVGVGTNYHAAQLASWLWTRAGLDAEAVHSFDFVARPWKVGRGDLGVFLSHRGTKSYTVKAESMARRAGAETVVVTGQGSPWAGGSRRIETCPLEDTGAFTKSLTTTMAWLLRWAGKPALLAPFKRADESLRFGPAFPEVAPETDVIVLGDGAREWLAAETSLKLQEAAYLRARSYGLEQFLHGPRVSAGRGSLVIGFTSPGEPRWDAARRYLAAIEVPFVEVASEDWLAQLFWGQRFTLACCRALGVDPDLLRTDDPRYARARKELEL